MGARSLSSQFCSLPGTGAFCPGDHLPLTVNCSAILSQFPYSTCQGIFLFSHYLISLSLTSCVSLGKLLNFPKIQVPNLQNKGYSSCLPHSLGGFIDLLGVGRETQRETLILLSHFLMLASVDPCMCPNPESNLQPWCISTML